MKAFILKTVIAVLFIIGFAIYGTGLASPDMIFSSTDNKTTYLGDVNGTGSIEVGDAISLLRYIVNIQSLEIEEFQRADVNLDGEVDVGDAIKILRYIVGLVNKFELVENPVIFTETALRYLLEETKAATVNLANNIHLKEKLIINRDITIENLYLIASPEEGSTMLSGELGTDAVLTIEAVSAEGFRFAHWLIDGEESDEREEIEYVMSAEKKSVKAVFEAIPSVYELRLAFEPDFGGFAVIVGDDTRELEQGDQVTLKAYPARGYKFLRWEAAAGSFEDINADETPFTMPAQDVTVKAVFELKTYQGYIPVASAEELQQIINPELNVFGAGIDEYEDHYFGGLDKNYRLVNDIDLENFIAENGWHPIGGIDDPFTGAFNAKGYDGATHIIKNLTINDGDNGFESAGLFASTARDAELKNITLENIDVKGKEYTGGIVGVNEGIIIDCVIIGDVYAVGEQWVGGLSGKNDNQGIIISSEVSPGEGSLISGFSVGGLAGINAGIIENSLAKIDIEGKENAGGLVGLNRGNITDCIVTGNLTVTGEKWAGGIAGNNENQGVIKNSRVIPEESEKKLVSGFGAGGLVGRNIGLLEGSHAKIDVKGQFYAGGLVGRNQGSKAIIIDCYASGDVWGTEESLEFFNDIPTEGLYTKLYELEIPGAGGLVGITISGEITGSYATGDVNTYLIGGGFIGSDILGSVSESHSVGSVTSSFHGGGFVGLNVLGETTGCYADGDVTVHEPEIELTAEDKKNLIFVGGRAGGFAAFNLHGTITNCYALGKVEGYDITGGLVGFNMGIVEACYARGNVKLTGNGIDNDFFRGCGGLAGLSSGQILNSYSLGNVEGEVYNSEVITGYGGLVGVLAEEEELTSENESENENELIIKNCYTAGAVVGSGKNVGGLIGTILNGNINYVVNSYYDTEKTGQETSAAGEPRTTDQMKYPYGQEVYAGWDFEHTWIEDRGFGLDNIGFNRGYPYLRWEERMTTLL